MTGPQSPPIRILIVDDHPVVRDGIRGMFTGDGGFEVVAEASDGQEAVAAATSLQPDVVLMDLRMPNMDGVEATAAIMESAPCGVLILTTYDTESDVLPAIEAGAIGYLLKDVSREEVVRAVRSAAAGESVLSPPIARRLMGQVRQPSRHPLSEREIEILREVANGATNRAIAEHLFISEATVKTHLVHIYEKLDVNDRAAAVAAGYERGLLNPGDATP